MNLSLSSKKRIKLFLITALLILPSMTITAQAAEGVTGDWDITLKYGEHQFDIKLNFAKNDQGQLTGKWISRRGTSDLKDVKFANNKLTFTRTSKHGNQDWTTKYIGTLSGDTLTGTLKSNRGETTAIAKRSTANSKKVAPALAAASDVIKPVRTEKVTPTRKESFNDNGTAKERKQGGNPREVSGLLAFDGSMDGNRQVDPQIAVGGGYVMHGTNGGLIIYDKKGNFVQGVHQNAFKGGIDPKMFYDRHNKVFGFDLWVYWDKEKVKPVNISISETSDPTGAWNTYQISASKGVDGGAIGYSKKWIGYAFPGGTEKTFILKMADAKAGKETTVYHFPGSLGLPIFSQDDIEDMYFLSVSNTHFTVRRVTDAGDGTPQCVTVASKAHGLKYINYPPKSPQKDTEQKTSSGDRNPKNLVLQNGYIWFSQAINCEGRSAVQWHQLKTDGTLVQTGLISSPTSNYIQTTIAVNKNEDVLVGFQETNENMFISPRLAFRKGTDPKGTIGKILSLGEGKGATDGVSWGDYSGSTVDGDNMLDLWTIQSITDETGKGDTVIVKVSFKDK